MKQHIADFLKFLESKGEKRVPIKIKLLYPDKLGPFTKEDLTVKKDLDLSFLDIESLPDNLTVGGNMWLTGSVIKSLPDNLTVGGFLILSYTEIQSIPNNLKIESNLYIGKTPLEKRMSIDEVRQEIERKGGYVKGEINIAV